MTAGTPEDGMGNGQRENELPASPRALASSKDARTTPASPPGCREGARSRAIPTCNQGKFRLSSPRSLFFFFFFLQFISRLCGAEWRSPHPAK